MRRPSWVEVEFSKASRALLEAHEAIDAIRVALTSGRERDKITGDAERREFFPERQEEKRGALPHCYPVEE